MDRAITYACTYPHLTFQVAPEQLLGLLLLVQAVPEVWAVVLAVVLVVGPACPLA